MFVTALLAPWRPARDASGAVQIPYGRSKSRFLSFFAKKDVFHAFPSPQPQAASLFTSTLDVYVEKSVTNANLDETLALHRRKWGLTRPAVTGVLTWQQAR